MELFLYKKLYTTVKTRRI